MSDISTEAIDTTETTELFGELVSWSKPVILSLDDWTQVSPAVRAAVDADIAATDYTGHPIKAVEYEDGALSAIHIDVKAPKSTTPGAFL